MVKLKANIGDPLATPKIWGSKRFAIMETLGVILVEIFEKDESS